jgi:hypothetical protein
MKVWGSSRFIKVLSQHRVDKTFHNTGIKLAHILDGTSLKEEAFSFERVSAIHTKTK